MYLEEFTSVAAAAKNKSAFLRHNPWGYFLASMLAGMFVGFGILLTSSIGGMLNGLPYVKIVMGVSFGIALSLVIIAGAELFTGNNMVMTAGVLTGQVTLHETMILWLICYLGNWAGSVLLAVMFWGAGFATGAIGDFIAVTAAAKMSIPVLPLILRGILCNILVCLAVWCGFRCKSESGKLIMIFWCLFAFITSGFEHSIANMTLLTLGLLAPQHAAVSWGGYFYNLSLVTLGNIVAAILFITIPYYIISKQKET